MDVNEYRKKNKTKRYWLICVVILLLTCSAFAIYFIKNGKFNINNTGDSKTYSGPTKEESEAGVRQKEANAEKDKQIEESEVDTSLKVASIVITDSSYYQYDNDQVEVRAYVSNIYEDSGVCTAVFTLGDKTVSQDGSSFKDAKTTQCGAMDVARSRFPSAGDWQLVVKYKSSTATGQTDPKTVIIK